jgi:diguanylate cyclase (GGDEF)-like protein
VSSFIGILVIFGVIIGILTMHYMSVIKSKKEISEAYHQIRTAKWEAKHDPLTGLYNRAAFQEICVNLKDYKSPIVLLIIDVDNFKKINDSHGHKVGDKALVKVANQLLVSFRPEDYVFRYAGDEFAIIMMNVRQIDASMISERVNNINEELKNVSNGAPSLSISVGAAFSETGYSEELFNLADKAMYSVKDSGRGGYAFSETS